MTNVLFQNRPKCPQRRRSHQSCLYGVYTGLWRPLLVVKLAPSSSNDAKVCIRNSHKLSSKLTTAASRSSTIFTLYPKKNGISMCGFTKILFDVVLFRGIKRRVKDKCYISAVVQMLQILLLVCSFVLIHNCHPFSSLAKALGLLREKRIHISNATYKMTTNMNQKHKIKLQHKTVKDKRFHSYPVPS